MPREGIALPAGTAGTACARICFLVWSYRDPLQVQRLVRRLLRSAPGARVVVRHDEFVSHLDPGAFDDLTEVSVLPRGVPVVWGEFSQVQAMLELFRHAARVPADWYPLLSGDDYPVRPLADLPGHLEATGADALLEETRSQEHAGLRADQGRNRYRYRYAALPGAPARLLTGTRPGRRLLRWSTGLNRKIPVLSVRPRVRGLPPLVGWRPPRHPFTGGLEPERSRNWFCMDRRALLRVLDRLDREPALIRWYGRTFVPSEGLFATLLRHDPAIRVHDGDLHWELWPPGSSSPRVLGVEDLPDVVSSSAFFARKFRECEALDRLDALLDPDATSDTERRLEPPVMPGPSAARVPFGSAPAGPRGVAP